jgi:hypothetical protein
LGGCTRNLGLQRLNALVRVLEGGILHQGGLDQRIERIGGLPQPIPDGPIGIRIARGILDCGQTSE